MAYYIRGIKSTAIIYGPDEVTIDSDGELFSPAYDMIVLGSLDDACATVKKTFETMLADWAATETPYRNPGGLHWVSQFGYYVLARDGEYVKIRKWGSES